MGGAAWNALGNIGLDLTARLEELRQLPRVARMRRLRDDSRISIARALARRAKASPERTFFVWQDVAFTYQQGAEQVGRVARALRARGLCKGMRVAVYGANHPHFLTSVCALSSLGAVAVLVPEGELSAIAGAVHVDAAITGAHSVGSVASAQLSVPVFVLGPAPPEGLAPGVIPLDEHLDGTSTIDPIHLGRGGDLALVVFVRSAEDEWAPVQLTNREWATACLATAVGCTLTPADTVYCDLDLHDARGVLAVGSALMGATRLALTPRFEVETFWRDARRYGVTVVWHTERIVEALLRAEKPERGQPLRLFVGSKLGADTRTRLRKRLGLQRVVDVFEPRDAR